MLSNCRGGGLEPCTHDGQPCLETGKAKWRPGTRKMSSWSRGRRFGLACRAPNIIPTMCVYRHYQIIGNLENVSIRAFLSQSLAKFRSGEK